MAWDQFLKKNLSVVLSLTYSILLNFVVISCARFSKMNLSPKALYIIVIFFLSWAFFFRRK